MGYPTGVTSFTSKQDGVDYPQASHINGLQTEVTAIENGLINGLQHALTVSTGGLTVSTGATVLGGTLNVTGGSTFAATIAAASTAVNLASSSAPFGAGHFSRLTILGTDVSATTPGITTTSTAVQQIAFAATQSASADANTLDDYEEGSWTPGDGSGAGLTLTNNGCRYIKIGQLVIAWFDIQYPATADATSASVSGLPFTPQAQMVSGCMTRTNMGAWIQPEPLTTSKIRFVDWSSNIKTNADISSKVLVGSVMYRASA